VEEFIAFFDTNLRNRGHEADVNQLVEECLNRSGLFRVLGNRVEFRHHLLQEFFAGRGIPSAKELERLVSNDWWQRAIIFYFGDHPGEIQAFNSLLPALEGKTPEELYVATVSLGLGLQACYLIETNEKLKVFGWVLRNIASAKKYFLESIDPSHKVPLAGFCAYFLISKDAVACNILCDNFEKIETSLVTKDTSAEDREMLQFWMLVGHLECAITEELRDKIRHFHPSDPRLLFAIHLGSFFAQNIRVCSKPEKKLAGEICQAVAGTVGALRKQIISELKSELLELRQGKLSAIEAPKSEAFSDTPTVDL
jgi:hypothetical protein